LQYDTAVNPGNFVKAMKAEPRHRQPETPNGRNSKGLCCRIGRITGFVLLAGGVDFALGGVFSDYRLHLCGTELPLSCLAGSLPLLGLYLVVATRQSGKTFAV
jgi:hypothetical protein